MITPEGDPSVVVLVVVNSVVVLKVVRNGNKGAVKDEVPVDVVDVDDGVTLAE